MPHAYLAAPEREAELSLELAQAGARVLQSYGRLLVAEGGPPQAAWASNVWLDVERIAIRSIAHAAQELKARGRNWALHSVAHHRRAALILEALPHVSAKPLAFGAEPPRAPLGSFSLIDADCLLASAHCTSSFPNGEVVFVEDRLAPPSRAYLKLWEAFTLLGCRPQPGETCLDLGSSPGGWTYVLAQLGARVTSVDKAPLAPQVLRLPNVKFLQQSAFALEPEAHPPVDWLFSDVICYPARLLQHVQRWRSSNKVGHFLCTLKFQGSTDHDVAREFAQIPGSRLMHLHHNRHELTWFCASTPAP
jgi:23S rRNA (cytidine2498-2'-O)-methyltransferase